MDDPLTHGHAFEYGDLWQEPKLLRALGEGPIFSPIDLTLPDLEDLNEEEAVFDLHIPDLILENGRSYHEAPVEDASAPPAKSTEDEDFHLHVWYLEDVSKTEQAAPRLHTWEAFEKDDVASLSEVALLSEAGPAAFDAFITSLEPRSETGVLPQDYTLRALCNLTLGRASSLFQWNGSKNTFEQTIPGVVISGSSKMCSESFIQQLVDMGSAIAQLRAFATLPRSLSKKCTAFLAMQNCVSDILNAVDESISARLATVRSLVRLHALVQQARRLICILSALSKAANGHENDEMLISTLSDGIHLEARIAPEFRSTLHALLARVSGPWLEQLASDMGFDNLATTSNGETSSQDQLKNAHFIDPEDKELIHETRLAISVLKDQAPGHPLLTHGHVGKNSPLSFFGGTEHTLQEARDVADAYQREVLSQIKGERRLDIGLARQTPDRGMDLTDQVWNDETFREKHFAALGAMMSKDVSSPSLSTTSSIKIHVLSLCMDPPIAAVATPDLSTESSFAPMEYVRPLIRTQNRLVNGVLMRQIFRDHRLRDHLELQRSFHLFGNGEFVSRLSTALFDQEAQSAERRRGKLPTSEAMGLRLGTTHEDRWPPASSELQLTLMGILIDTYRGRQTHQRSFVQNGGLSGSLSFSIRELPEEEIDRVLDPNSIYALDFLRLQYTSKAPINSILTSAALQKYDDVFKNILRLLRVVHVTADLGRKAVARKNEATNETAVSFAHAAHHLASVLLSHVMEMGIAAPWRSLDDSLQELEQTLSEEDVEDQMGFKLIIGIEGLRQLHDTCLERIRSRLFLKRKQEKLRKTLEGALAALLKTAFAIHHDESEEMPAFTSAHKEFRQSLSKFQSVLREQAEKPPKAIAADDLADTEMMRLLLARLNWNKYY